MEITVGALAPGGEGIGFVEDGGERRAVFVANVAPGDRVRVEADLTKRPARARVLEIVSPSSARVEPPCAWAAECGACDWMQIAHDSQVSAHAAIVEEFLPEPMRIVSHAAPRTLAYRVRARVHLVAERRRLAVGMFGRRTHEPVVVDTCAVLDPALERVRRMLAPLLEGARGRGEAQISLARPRRTRRAERGASGVSSRGRRGAEPPDREEPRLGVIDLRWSGELPADVFARLERAVVAHEIAGARVFAGEVKKPAVIGDPTPWIVGADGAPLRLAPGGFAQASEEANAMLARRVDELAREISPANASAVELYAGAGNLTILLARSFALSSIESDRAACEAARANLAERGLRARVSEQDATSFTIPPATKLVVLDPPRAGAKEVAKKLAAKPVAAVVYVSCDPATLGRDLATLTPAYALAHVETFEMFPQTSHVETVVALVKRKGGR
jgi:23S rRNA (uracil1939-C5)-methyltransferase